MEGIGEMESRGIVFLLLLGSFAVCFPFVHLLHILLLAVYTARLKHFSIIVTFRNLFFYHLSLACLSVCFFFHCLSNVSRSVVYILVGQSFFLLDPSIF